ncbi:solute carrier family 46 member 3-like [Plakobranchus ocellatus]|uniref:Solute carrier family 46 member 3-like n=1 Tax=Plakobranchus ocellatus TaxID=259542 RepID=A0AAV4CSR7_9GAST|nr:solute carrier family 46 member 3-like [Plakobranchus ocellatus]
MTLLGKIENGPDKSLVSSQPGPVAPSDKASQGKRQLASIQKLPYVLINTFIIILTVSDRNRIILLNQFLYNRLAREITGNLSTDTTRNPCGSFNASDTGASQSDSNNIQGMTSSMVMKFDLSVSLLGILGSLFLGAFSTSLGRRVQLLIPISGYTVRALSILAVAFWDLDISWLYVGCVAEGLTGGAPGVYLGVFLYVSDITPRNRKRTLGLALLEGIRGIMGSGINIASGQMIQRTSFLVPASFTACGGLLCVSMACLMPVRTQASETWSMKMMKTSWKTMVSPISKTQDYRVRHMVLVAAVAYFFGFSTIYSLDRFGRQAIFNTTIISLVPLLHRCFPGVSLAILGAVANIAEYTIYAFANTDLHLFGALAVSFGQGLPLNMIRGETSRLFGSEQQGPWFACLAVLENISFSVGLFLMAVYSMSLSFYVGLVFNVFALMTVVMIAFLCRFQSMWVTYQSTLVQCEKDVAAPVSLQTTDIDLGDDTVSAAERQVFLEKQQAPEC